MYVPTGRPIRDKSNDSYLIALPISMFSSQFFFIFSAFHVVELFAMFVTTIIPVVYSRQDHAEDYS